jgi:hypothetical protein
MFARIRINFVSPLVIASRRRAIATALVYGLSLTVRFASDAGEAAQTPGQVDQSNDPTTSIVINEGTQLFHRDWSPRPAPPTAAYRDCGGGHSSLQLKPLE